MADDGGDMPGEVRSGMKVTAFYLHFDEVVYLKELKKGYWKSYNFP